MSAWLQHPDLTRSYQLTRGHAGHQRMGPHGGQLTPVHSGQLPGVYNGQLTPVHSGQLTGGYNGQLSGVHGGQQGGAWESWQTTGPREGQMVGMRGSSGQPKELTRYGDSGCNSATGTADNPVVSESVLLEKFTKNRR